MYSLEKQRACRERWRKKNTAKCRVEKQFNYYFTEFMGWVRPTNCSLCGKVDTNIQAHHSDYGKVFQVVWVCQSCHQRIEREGIIELPIIDYNVIWGKDWWTRVPKCIDGRKKRYFFEERDKRILEMCKCGQTLESIGKEFGITRQRVYLICKRSKTPITR